MNQLKIKNSKFNINESGQALSEFALLVPVFFFLIFGTVQLMVIVNVYFTLNSLARTGTRYAALKGAKSNFTDDDIKEYIRGDPSNGYKDGQNSPLLYGGDVDITIDPPYGDSDRDKGNTIKVVLSYNLKGQRKKLFLPTTFGFGSAKITFPTTLKAEATARME